MPTRAADKIHASALQQVCREFIELCKALELFGGERVAIDGTLREFLAVNARQRNFNLAKLKHRLQELDLRIRTYLDELAQAEAADTDRPRTSPQELQSHLERLRQRQRRYPGYQTELETSGASQLSLTDPEARMMWAGQRTEVGYNLQIAVDDKHKLIVEHEVTNEVTDQAMLSVMAQRAKATLQVETLEVIADRGYYDGQEVKRCLEAGITPTIAKPYTSVNQHRGLYTKEEFIYDSVRDTYRCPQGAELGFRFDTVEAGRPIRYYKTTACQSCTAKSLCTTNKEGRRITRWVDEHLLEAMARRVAAQPERMQQRRELVEHPFGTIKRGMNQGYFLLRGLIKVRGEMSLTILAYNLKRVMNILGVNQLIAAVT